MIRISTKLASNIIRRGARNLMAKKPLAISFEITHSCNANCSHCDKNGIIENENLAPPEKFDEVYQQLQPPLAQISGGEPLLREDHLEIIKLFRSHGILPLIAFVSNGALMTLDKYLELRKAGVNQFSLSLDMPDERHDKNRRIPGLFKHLSDIIPRMSAMGFQDVALISVIRKQSLPYLIDIANKAIEWNVAITFSSYTQLRTKSDEHSIKTEADLQLLRKQIDALIEMRRRGARIVNAEAIFQGMFNFFKTNNIENCRTGIRHLVVNPDASLVPCAMHKVSFNSQKELIRNFTNKNKCGACYVPLRANTEMGLKEMVFDFGADFIRRAF